MQIKLTCINTYTVGVKYYKCNTLPNKAARFKQYLKIMLKLSSNSKLEEINKLLALCQNAT